MNDVEWALVGYSVLIACCAILGFFIWKVVTFVWKRKIIIHLMKQVNDTSYQEVKKIKKGFDVDSITWKDKKFILNTNKGFKELNNNHQLFFDINKAEPLSFHEANKGNSTLLKTVTKSNIWVRLFGEGEVNTPMIILIAMLAVTILLVFYLAYGNSQLSSQVTMLQKEIGNLTRTIDGLVNGGGIIIGK